MANGLVGASNRRGGGEGNDEAEPDQAERDARIAKEAAPEALHQPTLMRGSSSR